MPLFIQIGVAIEAFIGQTKAIAASKRVDATLGSRLWTAFVHCHSFRIDRLFVHLKGAKSKQSAQANYKCSAGGHTSHHITKSARERKWVCSPFSVQCLSPQMYKKKKPKPYHYGNCHQTGNISIAFNPKAHPASADFHFSYLTCNPNCHSILQPRYNFFNHLRLIQQALQSKLMPLYWNGYLLSRLHGSSYVMWFAYIQLHPHKTLRLFTGIQSIGFSLKFKPLPLAA